MQRPMAPPNTTLLTRVFIHNSLAYRSPLDFFTNILYFLFWFSVTLGYFHRY